MMQSPPASAAACLNCGATLIRAYCAECGQRVRDARPTVSTILGDFAAEAFQWDGKILRTLRALLRRPGMLTEEYLAGRRASYISPVKLWLLSSALFFAANAVTPPSPAGARIIRRTSLVDAMARAALSDTTMRSYDTSTFKGRRYTSMARSRARARKDPAAFARRVVNAVEQVMGLLVPLIAVLVAMLFHRGDLNYPQHLVFMLHVQAFVYIAVAVQQLSALQPSGIVWALLFFLTYPVVLVYIYQSARRVYRRGVISTVVRVIALAAAYIGVWFATVAATARLLGATY